MRLLPGGWAMVRRKVVRRIPVAALALALMANAVAFSNVFPYAPALVRHLGMSNDSRELGFYAGYFMSVNQFGQMLSSYHLGKLADTRGGKFVLSLALCSFITFQLPFGLSRSFGQAIAMRFLMGLPNALEVAAKAMAPDLVPPHEQGLVMSINAAMWGCGNIFGPALGGLLSETACQHNVSDGTLLCDETFLGRFPYLLPNLVSTAFSLLALLAVRSGLPDTAAGSAEPQSSEHWPEAETSRSNVEMTPSSDDHTARVVAVASPVAAAPGGLQKPAGQVQWRVGMLRMLPSLPQRAVPPLLTYIMLAFTSIMFDEILPLWCTAPRASGGLDLQTSAIGGVLTFSGFALLSFNLCVLPCLFTRISHTSLLKISCIVCAVLYFTFPAIASMPEGDASMAALLVAITLNRFGTASGFTSVFILINNSVRRDERARAHGLGMAGAAAVRSVGPLLGASTFAWSLTNTWQVPLLDVRMVFWLCSLGSLATGLLVHRHCPPSYNDEATAAAPATRADSTTDVSR